MSKRTAVHARTVGLGVSCVLATTGVACNAEQRRSESTSNAPAKSQASRVAPASTEAAVEEPPACPAALRAARKGGRDGDRYEAPSPERAQTLKAAVALLVGRGSAAVESAAPRLRQAGYELVELPEWPGTLLMRERPDERRGGGGYVVRLAGSSTLVVQAPHTFYDEGTLQLACELFARAQARMLFIDTAHRYLAADPDDNGDHPADVAHARESLFQAATLGLLEAARGAKVVQLHGFAPRESGVRVVLSAGVSRPAAPWPTRALRPIAQVVGAGVVRFPDETRELGATRNVQGAAVAEAGGEFLHVEVEGALRKALLSDAQLRARFLDALAGSSRAP